MDESDSNCLKKQGGQDWYHNTGHYAHQVYITQYGSTVYIRRDGPGFIIVYLRKP